jgi:hypothetical protein
MTLLCVAWVALYLSHRRFRGQACDDQTTSLGKEK